MSNTNPPDFSMTLGSVSFDQPDMKERVVSIEVECVADGPDYFKVELDDRDDYFGDSPIKEGDGASIALGYVNEDVIDVLEGTVTGVDTFRREYRRKIVVVSGFDYMHRLTRGRKRRNWQKMKIEDVVPSIAGEAGLGAECDSVGIVYDYIYQNNVTNLDFLYERARRVGFEVDVHKKTLRFKKPELTDPVVKLVWDQTNIGRNDSSTRLLKRCDFNANTMGQVEEVTVKHWDPDKKEMIEARSSDIHGGTMGGSQTGPDFASADAPSLKIQVSDQPVRSVEEAEKLAWSILNQRAKEFITGQGQCEGDGRLKAGKAVEIDAVGSKFDGKYYIAKAHHKLKVGAGAGNGYTTDFEVKRTGSG